MSYTTTNIDTQLLQEFESFIQGMEAAGRDCTLLRQVHRRGLQLDLQREIDQALDAAEVPEPTVDDYLLPSQVRRIRHLRREMARRDADSISRAVLIKALTEVGDNQQLSTIEDQGDLWFSANQVVELVRTQPGLDKLPHQQVW